VVRAVSPRSTLFPGAIEAVMISDTRPTEAPSVINILISTWSVECQLSFMFVGQLRNTSTLPRLEGRTDAPIGDEGRIPEVEFFSLLDS
jgi:hypothetical protein